MFIAVHLDASIKRELEKLQSAVRAGNTVRWVKPDQMHLTLKFLGDVSADAVPSVIAGLQRIGSEFAPFALKLGGWGCFPNFSKPRVIWIGLEGALDPLRGLQARVEQETASLSGHKEDKPFAPHLTLGRTKDAPFRDIQRLGQLIQAARPSSGAAWTIQHLYLMRSVLGQSGATHHVLAQVPLSAGAQDQAISIP